MAIDRCPGQDTRFWTPDDVFELPCPGCGTNIEFWKDDPQRRCRGCGRVVANPKRDTGCAEWCAHAAECLCAGGQGDVGALREALLEAMEAEFGNDARRIAHAREVLDAAETIHASEGGDGLVVRAAAILHDIGIREAERKHGSAAPKWQEEEGPPVAARILERLGIAEEAARHVLDIVATHHSAGRLDTPEFRIVWDADRLANRDDEVGSKSPEATRAFIAKAYRTETGRAMALARVEA